jgi:uncharacterized membrane protein YcaP (DUF421 family)
MQQWFNVSLIVPNYVIISLWAYAAFPISGKRSNISQLGVGDLVVDYRFGKEAVAALLGTRRAVLANPVLNFTHCRIVLIVQRSGNP